LNAYDYNDDNAEMSAAAADLRLSNHSYGIICGWDSFGLSWYGDPNISNDEDYKFGFYTENESKAWDQIAYNAPYYLIVKSAGNDRGHGPLLGSSHPADAEPDSGYDTIGPQGVAKDILTVGAVNDIPNGYSQPSDVVMSSFSSWGPTDDGRIKPDIVANGVGLYSSTAGSDNAYSTYDGTSMSSPNATGSLTLLQEHYANLHNGDWMLASTLKALVIHTADEAGDADGPDFRFGWGLLNTEKAANLITEANNSALTSTIRVDTLQENQTISYQIHTDGTSPLKITICWTDAPGKPVAPQLDPPDLMLINDLDMRLVGTDSTYMPWVLDPINRTVPATTGDNFRDNVEQIYVAAPPAGDYTIQISHKDTLYNNQQVFSIVINDAQFNGSPNTLEKASEAAPNKFRLYGNYPNPFNPSTNIRFDLATAGRTTLTVYDALGKKITTLVDKYLPAGQYTFKWNAGQLSSGIYFYRLQTGKLSQVKRMLLVK
ncbi:MAG TPA: T9SS type A sorting domain-containing protein, partial [Caldithrix abyssi]|nr:T9SS type A sorting domain-containing protein [Caldithrix abyssi]